jgi:hypothetical protein
MDYKIRVKTKAQRELIEDNAIVSKVSEDGCYVVLSCETVSFDELAAIIDCVRPKISLDLSIVAPNMIEPVETWLAYKKEKAQSYKPTGFKTFYKKLCELSGNNPQVAMAIIEQSMQNNYAGIFPLRNNNNNNNYGRETITDKIRRTVEEANAFSEQLRSRIGEQADVCDGDTDEAW